MAAAVVGDDVFRDDPSILQLGKNKIFMLYSLYSMKWNLKIIAVQRTEWPN